MDVKNLELHPDRATLTLFAATGLFQVGSTEKAKQYIFLAQEWGCPRQQILQLLVSGVYNNFGCIAAINNNKNRINKLFEEAIFIAIPEVAQKLLVQAREQFQVVQYNNKKHKDTQLIKTYLDKQGRISSLTQQQLTGLGEDTANLALLGCRWSEAIWLWNKIISKNPDHLEAFHKKAYAQAALRQSYIQKTNSSSYNKVTEMALSLQSFDQEKRLPSIKYIVCSTGRSGSFLMCRQLFNSGLGIPHEYFNKMHQNIISNRMGLDADNDQCYVNFLLSHRVTKNHVWGTKLHWNQCLYRDDFFKKNFLNTNVKYIFLYREDVIAQAVSYHISLITGYWGFDGLKTTSSKNIDLNNMEHIQKCYEIILKGNLYWKVFFEENKITPLYIKYEDFVKDQTNCVSKVASFLGVPKSEYKSCESEDKENLNPEYLEVVRNKLMQKCLSKLEMFRQRSRDIFGSKLPAILDKNKKQKIHFLHIGKTGGSALKFALKDFLETDNYSLELHGHNTSLKDIPKGELVIFFLRDPVSRFISGFYNRKRKGQPRYCFEWTSIEKELFEHFMTPNQLAISLGDEQSDDHELAVMSMENVQHFKAYSNWYVNFEYFQSRIDDILFIGFQESLNSDFFALKNILDIPDHIELPSDHVTAHKNPDSLNIVINETGLLALNNWYSDDFKFIYLCQKIMLSKQIHAK
ncbi:Stf0 sulphotransferase [Candidatus Venteria ishoeyi]|uniref:Stf0 sulphotransferase n=1 Tax=Candidatus Venteria ishoeyi TaxID=1899563 RepID=A0A1H6FGK0_9GAMM|nr:Stf0 sulphotransferase [Candidatus Venteria ishoeyi]